MRSYRRIVLLCSLLSSTSFAAAPIQYQGVRAHQLAKSTPVDLQVQAPSAQKSVTALTIKVSDSVIHALQKRLSHRLPRMQSTRKLPASKQLGMHQVPVFDQGIVYDPRLLTLIAALDALRGVGDYYSLSCSMMLANYLNTNTYATGTNLFESLSRAAEFGLVTKEQQEAQGCAGIRVENAFIINPTHTVSVEQFHGVSVPLTDSGLSFARNVFSSPEWLSNDLSPDLILEKVKTSLYFGNRLLLGAIIPVQHDTWLVAGHHHAPHDTWVLTPKIEQLVMYLNGSIDLDILDNFGFQSMVMTGYDDAAWAVDADGHLHKGLFTLRNSWGPDVGDHGNFYMSYDYFSALALQATELVQLSL